MKTAIVIPARIDSKRLHGKLMLDVNGKPLIWYTIYNSLRCGIQDVFVATQDKVIYDYVSSLDDVKAILTDDCVSGTHRISKIASNLKKVYKIDYIINLQGDEPTIDNQLVTQLLQSLQKHPNVIFTAAVKTDDTVVNNNIVKVVVDKDDYAMYFSRSHIPYKPEFIYKHVGIYAYPIDFFDNYSSMIKCPYNNENLEQLDWLYNRILVKVMMTNRFPIGVNTLNDYRNIRQYFAKNNPNETISQGY